MNDTKIEKMFNYPDMFGSDEFKQGFEYLYNKLEIALADNERLITENDSLSAKVYDYEERLGLDNN